MKVRLSDLDCSVRDAFEGLDPSDFASLARLAAGTQDEDPELSLRDAARAITAMLVDRGLCGDLREESLTIADGVPLAKVQTAWGGINKDLPSTVVPEHPLFRGWVGMDLPGVVEQMLRAGAILTQTAPDAPLWGELHITDYGGGVIGATVSQGWPLRELTACSFYGAAGTEAAVRRTLAVKAEVIIGVGGGTPLADMQGRADEAAVASAVKAAIQAAGAYAH